LGTSSTTNSNINRLKSAVAKFWGNYRSAIENGQFYVPMP
jgi:hypothetical protein